MNSMIKKLLLRILIPKLIKNNNKKHKPKKMKIPTRDNSKHLHHVQKLSQSNNQISFPLKLSAKAANLHRNHLHLSKI